MTKVQFMGVFLGFISKKIDTWLPEEATEELMLDIMMQRIYEHRLEIRKVLIKNEL